MSAQALVKWPSSKGVRRGPGIRVAGAILILPLPLAFAVGLCYGMYVAAQGKQLDKAAQLRMSLMELALTVFCVVLACVIAAAFSERKRPRRKRYDDDLDWDEDRPRRRRRHFEDEDGYEEDAPSSRSRDLEDEDEDRPRRRRRVEDDMG